MKLTDLINLMDYDELIEIDDEDLPIDRCTLFEGSVKQLKQHSWLCNATVTAINPIHDVLFVLVSRKEKK